MKRVGIAFSVGPSPAEIVGCVQLAESLGFESAWVAEGHGGDQFAVLAACATSTSRIALGTAISSVFVRSAPTIAMAAATVDDISNGRFILGLGSSHKVQVEPEHDVIYAKPLTRVRETVELIRNLLRDGEVQLDGDTLRIKHFDLWFSPRRRQIPIYLSAVFEKMTALCGEVADGVILTRSTLRTAATARAWLAQGALRTGRSVAEVDVTTLIPTTVATTRAEALARMRPGLAFYAGFFPRYNRLVAEHGFAEEANAIATAWAQGNHEEAVRCVSDAMVDSMSIAGTAEHCRERIEAYRQSGIDLPILSPFARGAQARAQFEAVMRACAPAQAD